MTESEILDILEKAYNAGCFPDVLKMVKAKSDKVMIEKVIKIAQKRKDDFDLDWSNIFGAD